MPNLKSSCSMRKSAKRLTYAGALALVGARNSVEARQCLEIGQNCRSNAECCEGYCDTNTFQCGCPPGTNLCLSNPPRRQCITCTGGQVFNPQNCRCECLGQQVRCSAGGP
jgi:hypothetical protein